jgi:hypothetical protein
MRCFCRKHNSVLVPGNDGSGSCFYCCQYGNDLEYLKVNGGCSIFDEIILMLFNILSIFIMQFHAEIWPADKYYFTR